MTSIADVRNDLASAFRNGAVWRNYGSTDRGRDDTFGKMKNDNYAGSLEEAAAYVESLGDDDPVLRKAADVDFEIASERLHTETIHCRFRELGIAACVENWVEAALDMTKKGRIQLQQDALDGYPRFRAGRDSGE